MSRWSVKNIAKRLTARLEEKARIRDMEPQFIEIWNRCRPFTMTSVERGYALYKALEYVVRNEIEGDVVECGVWRGGSSMLCAYTLLELGDTARTIYLYDTFAGMSEPTVRDVTIGEQSAVERWTRAQKDSYNEWCYAGLDEVKANLDGTGYPAARLRFIQGKVEETIPSVIAPSIAILRLDTDWYESTLHELMHLYPRLSPRGVLIVDDYGHWKGAREAVDRYIADQQLSLLLNRVDYTGRVALKPC